jgi:hypothetical protein
MSATQTQHVLDRLLESGRFEGKRRDAMLAAASDGELVDTAFGLASKIDEPDEVRDHLYAVLTEAFERWVPEAAWESDVNATRDSGVLDLRWELESNLEAVIRRASARLTARCQISDEEVASRARPRVGSSDKRGSPRGGRGLGAWFCSSKPRRRRSWASTSSHRVGGTNTSSSSGGREMPSTA